MLRFLENFEIMDYQQEGDIGFKKPKVIFLFFCSILPLKSYLQTKKKRPSCRVAETDPANLPPDKMDVDLEEKPSARVRDLDDAFVDDEDIQAVLARQRRAKVKKAKPLDPAEIARKSMYISIIFL
jgi:U4/U6.U5 tri-snRNP-associated protein 1